MNETPKIRIVEKTETLRLYLEHVKPRLDKLSAKIIPPHNAGSEELLSHEAFCCKKTTSSYSDLDTGEEVALVTQITPVPGSKIEPSTIVSRLKHGDELLVAKLFDAASGGTST